jgi:hypothetical protein
MSLCDIGSASDHSTGEKFFASCNPTLMKGFGDTFAPIGRFRRPTLWGESRWKPRAPSRQTP